MSAATTSTISLEAPNLALQIRNLTPKFSYQDRNELLYGLGATSVHNYPYFSVAFFPNELSCQMVIRLLHQRQLNHRLLRVEFAKPEQIRRLPSHLICDISLKDKIKHGQIDAFFDRTRNLEFRINKNLSNCNFKFPKANTVIVNTIEHHLLNNEQFYHHVLLLMIQFGLDPPFEDYSLSSIPLPSDDESELESDLNPNDLNQSQAPQFELKRRKRKRKKLKTGFIGNKSESLANLIKKPKSTTVIEEVFENENNSKCTKLSINVPVTIDNKLSNPQINNDQIEGFGLLPSKERKTQESSKSYPINDNSFDVCLISKQDLISDEELVQNRILESEWSKFPVFNNYSSGIESYRLYVKNIHRKVTLKDLYRLFAKYINLDNDDHLNNFGIVYMEKGRMRGQAFVTYPLLEQAQCALSSTNGYVFIDKPIVVAFARSCRVSE